MTSNSHKVLLLGDSGVGKTGIFKRIKSDEFSPCEKSTVKMDTFTKEVTYSGKKVKIELWDTAGQEKLWALTRNYYRGASAVILAYAITNIESFESLFNWIGEIKNYCDEEVVVILVGCKSDLVSERKVEFGQGASLADYYSFRFLEVSAMNGLNINTLLEALAKQILTKPKRPVKEIEKIVIAKQCDNCKNSRSCC